MFLWRIFIVGGWVELAWWFLGEKVFSISHEKLNFGLGLRLKNIGLRNSLREIQKNLVYGNMKQNYRLL
jgi:hypothetical protein